MKERLFRFKKFEVSHSKCAMPIGVDGVLIGAWAECDGTRILDVGTGCGVIALMMAQRYPESMIDAIDIHEPSVDEAVMNFERSPWSGRLRCFRESFQDIKTEGSYDLIVSNPPFYDSGVICQDSPRLAARHVGSLSPETLIDGSCGLLSPEGRLSMIVVAEMSQKIVDYALSKGYSLIRRCYVRDNESAPVKRAMLEFMRNKDIVSEEKDYDAETLNVENVIDTRLTMFGPQRVPTDEYCQLCGQFYLKF